MRSFLMFVVVLPQIVFCDNANLHDANPNTNNDNEKYTQNNHLAPSSLYCNDLNPQMHLDFNMVNNFVVYLLWELESAKNSF